MRVFYNKTATVSRLRDDVDNSSKEAYAVLGTVRGSLMNANPADSMLSEGNPSKSSSWFCDVASDIKDADKLTIDGIDYVAKGVSDTGGIGFSVSYKKVLLEKLAS